MPQLRLLRTRRVAKPMACTSTSRGGIQPRPPAGPTLRHLFRTASAIPVRVIRQARRTHRPVRRFVHGCGNHPDGPRDGAGECADEGVGRHGQHDGHLADGPDLSEGVERWDLRRSSRTSTPPPRNGQGEPGEHRPVAHRVYAVSNNSGTSRTWSSTWRAGSADRPGHRRPGHGTPRPVTGCPLEHCRTAYCMVITGPTGASPSSTSGSPRSRGMPSTAVPRRHREPVCRPGVGRFAGGGRPRR